MVCLDTNFLIDIINGREIPEKIQDILKIGVSVSIASPSITELIKGIHLERNLKYVSEEEKKRIELALSSFTILNLDKESAIISGEIEAELENKGEPIGIEDIMIGAIAKHNNETLITRNKKHFEKILGLKIISY